MTLWVGIDDTDSPRGGCTTFVLTELLALAAEHDLDLVGEPRLVRLNPNIPWKTRGNAALSARFGRGAGRPRLVGEVGERQLRSFPRGRAPSPHAVERFLDAAWSVVRASAQTGEKGTDPAMVATERPFPARWYHRAVQEVVAVDQVRQELAAAGVWMRTEGSDQGLVGAAASIARPWPPGHVGADLLPPIRSGTGDRARWTRARVRAAQAADPRLFLCFDRRTRRLLVAPHTPCPILFGLRGTTRDAPLRARERVRSEPVERWVLFRTNQGTGDHLIRREADRWPDYCSGWIGGEVRAPGVALRGGHVRFSIVPSRGPPVVCLAFEPTKTLPRVAQDLRAGDRVRVWGSRGTRPEVRLEGIELLRWAPTQSGTRPPHCMSCRRSRPVPGPAAGISVPRSVTDVGPRRRPPIPLALPLGTSGRTTPRLRRGATWPRWAPNRSPRARTNAFEGWLALTYRGATHATRSPAPHHSSSTGGPGPRRRPPDLRGE